MPRDDDTVVPGAEDALDRFKWEVAGDLGLVPKVREVGWENMTTREVGKIGGHMVKRMIAAAEENLKREAVQGDPTAGAARTAPQSPPAQVSAPAALQSAEPWRPESPEPDLAWHQRPPRRAPTDSQYR